MSLEPFRRNTIIHIAEQPFEIIRTNIPDDSDKIIKKAHIVIFTEFHHDHNYRKANGRAIDAIWLNGSLLLTEDGTKGPKSQVAFVREEITQEALDCWDDPALTEGVFDLQAAQRSLAYLDLWEKYATLFQKEPMTQEDFPQIIAALKESHENLIIYLNYVKSQSAAINNIFIKRNQYLTARLTKAVEKTQTTTKAVFGREEEKKLVVTVGGIKHFEVSKDMEWATDAVHALYTQLADENICFVALKAVVPKKALSELEQDSSESTVFFEKYDKFYRNLKKMLHPEYVGEMVILLINSCDFIFDIHNRLLSEARRLASTGVKLEK